MPFLVIAEVLLLASEELQVLATTHSPGLLDNKAIREDHLLAVIAEEGETLIGPADAATRSVLRDRLYTAGELLSQGPVLPDLDAVREEARQLRLFDGSDGDASRRLPGRRLGIRFDPTSVPRADGHEPLASRVDGCP